MTLDREFLKRDPDPEVWRNWQGAVLLRDEIERYCKSPFFKLIDPFEPRCLKPASYHLRLGASCRVDGEDREISSEKPRLTIPPHGIAIVSTLEKVTIPGFLVARWNLKVKKVYEGLVWVGGPQVDPGYNGKLLCPLYNLSNKEVHLEYSEPLFTIDFVRTTKFDETKGCKLLELNPERPTDSAGALGALDKIPLKSAPKEKFVEYDNKMKEMNDLLERSQNRIDTFQGITFTILGIIVAALAFVSVSQFTDVSVSQLTHMNAQNPHWWQIGTWIVVPVAILILTVVLAISAIRVLWHR